METDALNEVKEKVSQGYLARKWLLVVVWCSTRGDGLAKDGSDWLLDSRR